ncbi:hypothetical protein KBD34_01700 [Patescibacteria group bacterium]|nr:hypothetical protein [Patescibacteria group bacterium]
MHTVIENMKNRAEAIKMDLKELISLHSSLHYKTPHRLVVVAGGDFFWNPLQEAGRQIQSKIIDSYDKFCETIHILLKDQPDKTTRQLSQYESSVRKTIEQNRNRPNDDKMAVLTEALQSIDQQINLLDSLYHILPDHETVYVPDTNALLYNVHLDRWRFTGSAKFTVALTPTVLSELDILKISHRSEDVRAKAETLIRTIKGYRIRGRLTQGIPLVKGVSQLIAFATEPKVAESLSWLDFSNKDDRYLASVIEVMRKMPRSPVVIITRDINLQNKAEFAELPYVEPPELLQD